MSRTLLAMTLTLVLAGLMACGGGDSFSEGSTSHVSAALSAPSLTPVPVSPGTVERSWHGTPVELMLADALASCTPPPWDGESVYGFNEDNYLAYIHGQMDNALSASCQQPPAPGQTSTELRWFSQRNDADCNIDPSSGTHKSANLVRSVPRIKLPVVGPFYPEIWGRVTNSFATRMMQMPIVNLCVAQHLRSRSPGASAGEALLLSAADQRQLLALTKDRAQLAMLQLAHRARVFTTEPVPNPGSVSNVNSSNPAERGWPWSFIPVLQQWAQSGNAAIEMPDHSDVNALQLLGEELAAAVQLHVTASQELAQLLSRSGAARMPRGASPSDPEWAALGRQGFSVDLWGPGAWRQRALASLYGGDPLAEDESGSTPWKHFKASRGPGETGSSTSGAWPLPGDAPFVATTLDDPKVTQLFSLARNADALYLQKTEDVVARPRWGYACRDVIRETSKERIYRATEAYLRTKGCRRYQANDDTCKLFGVDEIPSTDLGYADFELWTKYRIAPEHAATLVAWLDEIIGKQCTRSVNEWTDENSYSYTSSVDFNSRGPLDFAGRIEAATLPDGSYYHLVDYVPKTRTLRETAGLFARYSNFGIPRQIFPEADATSQGFQVDEVTSNAHEEMRLMGAVPALAATREALLDSIRGLPSLGALAPNVAPMFALKQSMLSMIDGAVGRSGVSVSPVVSHIDVSVNSEGWHRKIAVPDRRQRIVDVAFDSIDSFWEAPSSQLKLLAIPNDPNVTSVAANAGSVSLGGGISALLSNLRRSESLNPTRIDAPEALIAPSVWRFAIELNPSDEEYSFVVQREQSGSIQYRPVASHLETFAGDFGVPGGSPRRQYLSFNGTLSNFAARIMAVDLSNPAKPAFDGFGLPNAWLPPADPALFGGTQGDDALTSYLRKARAGAEEATAAVKEAFEEMLKAQEDEATLGAAVSNAEKVQQLERSALCGTGKCDTQMVNTSVSPAAIWNAPRERWTLQQLDPSVGGGIQKIYITPPSWSSLPALCQASQGSTAIDKLADLNPTTRLDCLAATILSATSIDVPVLQSVAQQRTVPVAPSFSEYSGGTLQAIAIEQWTALRSLEDRIRGLVAATDAAIGHANLLRGELNNATGQKAEMKKRCEHFEEDLVKQTCSYEVTGFPWGFLGMGEERVCIETKREFSDYEWEDETSFGKSRSDSLGRSASIGANGAGFGVSWTDSNGTSASMTSAAGRRRVCEGYRTAVDSTAWRLMDGTLQAYANIQERAVEFTNAVGRVQSASAAGLAARHEADLATARTNLAVDLLRASQTTSFGLYRQLHSYDAWRAKALLDGARLGAAVARKAIESRYLVNLSELSAPEPLVASPSTWADEVYEYDLDMPTAVGLSVGEAVPSGIYANRVLDYVGNLERFVNGFSIARPTAVAHGDTELISLPGPKGLDTGLLPGTDLPDGRAYSWSYWCPEGAKAGWRPLAPNATPTAVCGDPPSRPTRASLLFSLDPWGRLNGDIADEPFARRYNARWERLAVNLVGTGVLDCSRARDRNACYTQPFLRYRLAHRGPSFVTSADQRWMLLPVLTGQIEGAKALAAEQWLDPISNAWTRPYVSAIARSEFDTRPLGGTYEAVFELGPEVVLERIERVQVLASSSYWVQQGYVPDAPTQPDRAPTLSSVDYHLFDSAGGDILRLTGTNLLDASALIDPGGPNERSCTILSATPTELEIQTPSIPAGTYGIAVRAETGTSNTLAGANGVEAFNLNGLAWSGAYDASYNGAAWAPTATSGTSASAGSLTGATNRPSVGPPVNAYRPAAFDGVNDMLTGAVASTYVTDSASTILVHSKIVSAPQDAIATAPYGNPALLGTQTGGHVIFGINSDGLRAAIYNGAYVQTSPSTVPAAAGAWHVFMLRWGAGTMEQGVDGSNLSVAATTGPSMGGLATSLRVGVNYNASKFANAQILNIRTIKSKLDDETVAKISAAWRCRYRL